MSTTTQWREGPGVLPVLRDALEGLSSADPQTWRLADEQVAAGLSTVGQVRALLDVAEVALVREGVERGLPAEAGRTPHDWVSCLEGEAAPVPPIGHVACVVRVAKGAPSLAGVVEALVAGDLPLGKADSLVRFVEQVRPVADAQALEEDLAILLRGARDEVVTGGPDGRRPERRAGLGEKELRVAIAQTGRLLKPVRDLEREDRHAKNARSFSKSAGPAGMSAYRVLLDPEGAAVLDSAIAALSAPVKDEESGELDPRPAWLRRADALVEIVRRGVSAPGEAPRSEKAQVMVTIPWATLQEGIRGGGVTATGEVLPPSVVRRMACDAKIIPVVLGGAGEVLELGRAVRLFSPGQKRALWLRDQGCTFPGCTMPAQWCDAHHVTWWCRGGASDVSNAALLCQRHHTRVHDKDLTATVTDAGVTWHV